MNPAPSRAPQRQQRGGEMSARYGGGLQFFADAPPAGVEGGAATARTFFPVPGGGGEQQPPERAMRQQHYGGGGSGAAEISLGHGHGHGGKHHFHQFGVEAKDGGGGGDQSGFLTRHNSSPPGFFSSPVMDNGFSSSARPAGSSLGEVRHGAMSSSSNNKKKMKAPLSFASSRQGSGGLSQISEDGIPDLTDSIHGAAHHHGRSEENVSTHDHVVRSFSSGGFSIGSWEDSNSIVFSTSTGKSGAHGNDDIIATLSNYESQLVAPREMAGVEKYLQMQHDQVPFRVRAKRGCATHPRSIAERERRTRISEKLRKLQALVPNMDKQTSTSDMLDLAVDHIKGLQSQLQTLKEDKEKCTCSCKQASRNRPAD
uniref:BHLH domain-containing protein n=1 Tax=Oryza rufipogon TaxID=4529 RepID=A0A0E0PAV4_ORYRU